MTDNLDVPTDAAPVEAGERAWRCFHCDDLFTDERAARDHFGATMESDPACKIKAGAEQSLVRALRVAEDAAAEAWQAIHSESTDAAKAHFGQATRHRQQLMAAEEAGYERGLSDGRGLATPSPNPVATTEVERAASQIYKVLREWTVPGMCEADDPTSPYPLVDLLSDPAPSDISSGEARLRDLAGDIAFALSNPVETETAKSDAMREALLMARNYVSDAAAGRLAYGDSGDGFIAMAKEDVERIDAALSGDPS